MEYIKKIVRECFRYKISGIAMVSCLVISMLAMHYGIAIYSNILEEHMEKNNYRYRYELNISGVADTIEDIPHLPDSVKCNMKIRKIMVHDDTENVTRIVDIIIGSYKEKWPLLSGEYASREMMESGEKIVLIGQNLEKKAYYKDDNVYYRISGEEYRVIGVLGSEKSCIFDDCIIMYNNCLGKEIKKGITDSAQGLNITMESDDEDVNDIYDRYIKDSYSMAKSAITGEYYDSFLSTVDPTYNEKEYCIMIYVFSFACIWIIIKFWLAQRIPEMRICRAFGFSNRKIIFRLIYSITSMFIVSMTIFIFIISILQIVINNIFSDYKLFFSIKNMLIYLIIFILSLVVIGGKSVYIFVNKNIAESI